MADANKPSINLRLVIGPCDAEPMLACVKGATELGFDSVTVYLTAPETEIYDALKPYAGILEKGAGLDAKDCDREDVPKVAFVDSLASAITRGGKPDVCLVFWEKSDSYTDMRAAVKKAVDAHVAAGSADAFNCTVVIGPASGINDYDLEVVNSVCQNVATGSLSTFVTSVDVAAVAGCAIANYEVNAAFQGVRA